MHDKKRRIEEYERAYSSHYGFEHTMVASRQRAAMEVLESSTPETVLEVGCGLDLLYAKADDAALPIGNWVIVEPAERFAELARAHGGSNIRKSVVHGFLEDSVETVLSACGDKPDLVIASALLSDACAEPAQILDCIRRVIRANGWLHVSVANSHSFHRRLAAAMGIIPDVKTPSARNQVLGQTRLFDLEQLKSCVQAAGFSVVQAGGYLIKPFAHAQIEGSPELFTPAVIKGLWNLGRELPEWASEIFVNARPAP